MQNGFLTARIYTSRGSFPVYEAIVTVTGTQNGRTEIIAKRTTDRNGQITPVAISAPDKSLSLEPGNADVFTLVDVRIDHPLYYTVIIKNVQIFGGETTVVDTPLIPLPDNQSEDNAAEEFVESPQNL